jgi:hypothetical protein
MDLQALKLLFGLPGDTQILTGEIPASLVEDLPIPEGAQAIACLTIPSGGFHIVFSMIQSLEAAKAQYCQQLLEADWVEQKIPENYQGFNMSPKAVKNALDRSLKFHHPRHDLNLTVQINPRPESRELIGFSLTLVAATQPQPSSVFDLPPFPPLSDPPDAIRKISSGGTYAEYASYIHLSTALNLQALVSHYQRQLVEAKWTFRDSGQNGALAWQVWTIEDPQKRIWSGVLNITQLGGVDNQFVVYMRVSLSTQPKPEFQSQ